jgi:hypothetical protein
MLARVNQMMAEIVNRGLFIMHMNGNLRQAATYMALHEVPMEVAKRVLLYPHLRRLSDWH